MKLIVATISLMMLLIRGTDCRASGVCDDWVKRGGYCVDYVKSRVPTFPVPKDAAEIALLSNKSSRDVAVGDVAIFFLGRYWHVAYIEKVHLDQQGDPTAIDVSEMNFGERLTEDDYMKEWRLKKTSEWKRAVSCGVTSEYGDIDWRSNVALSSVQQIWSPAVAASRGGAVKKNWLVERVRDAYNHILRLTGVEL